MRAVVAPILLLCVACGSSSPSPTETNEGPDVPAIASALIGPGGGVVALADGTLVSIPAGALDSYVTITVELAPDAPMPRQGTPAGSVYLLGPEGQRFAKPVSVTLALQPSELPEGESSADVTVYTEPRASSAGAYMPMPPKVVDSSHVLVETSHFSYFTVRGASGKPAAINIGFNGGSAQFAYFDDFFQSPAAVMNPGPRLCHWYVPWNVAEQGEGSVSSTKSLAYLKSWLHDAEGECDEALISFQAESHAKPPTQHQFKDAFEAFLGKSWAKDTGFTGSFSFTPWNEPNNAADSGNGLGEVIPPELAAAYYLTAEHLCASHGCKVAAGDFASNGNTWDDFEWNCSSDDVAAADLCKKPSSYNTSHTAPASYLDRYKNYIYNNAAGYHLGANFRPRYFAFHGWHDINEYLDTGSLCSDYTNCATRRLLTSLGGSWHGVELWDTEAGIGQSTAYAPSVQACGAAFLLDITALDPRITRLYVTRLHGGDAQLLAGHTPLPAMTVLASRHAAAAGTCSVVAPPAAGEVSLWTTSDKAHPFVSQSAIHLGAPGSAAGSVGTLTIDDSAGNLRQAVDGFGAALTDASAAIMYYQMSAANRAELLGELMSPETGLGLNMLRVPIAASDSTWDGAYSYDDRPQDDPDPSLKHFSIAHDEKYILPELQQIVGDINPDVHVVATPWSPPAWMKQGTTSMVGGTLKAEYREAYAEYFVHFVRAYWEQPVHIPIYAITPQNEPGEAAAYPSMSLTASEEATFIHGYLAPAMNKARFGWVRIFGYDHNWGNSYPDDLLGALGGSASDIQGMAFHCYGGNKSASLTTLHDDARMQGKDIFMTECDRSQYDDGKLKSYAEGIEKLIYAMNNWSRSYLAWQLVLHPDGTPDQGNGCKGDDWHCVGVVSVDDKGTVTKEWDYAYLGHASKFVARGARVVSLPEVGRVESVAFVNPDGTRVLVAYNASETATETFDVAWQGKGFSAKIAPRSAATFTWAGPPLSEATPSGDSATGSGSGSASATSSTASSAASGRCCALCSNASAPYYAGDVQGETCAAIAQIFCLGNGGSSVVSSSIGSCEDQP